ncbi:MAG: hypothetical protein JNL21_07185 [Myxococcales bacterium]|nr:hypothetical protein [Myxococcales bacterium]
MIIKNGKRSNTLQIGSSSWRRSSLHLAPELARFATGLGLLALATTTFACGDDSGTGGSSGSETSGTTTGSTSSGQTTGSTSSTGGTGGSGNGGGGTGGEGAGGGTPIDTCEPNDGLTIEPTCGIFVNTNANEGGNGTQGAPFNSLASAVAASDDANSRIYVCGAVDESVTVPGGRSVHGELDCSWEWDLAARTPWTAPNDTIPLRLQQGPSAAIITGFAIESRDAAMPQGSSIAVIAEGGNVDLRRVDISAGSAQSGAPGVTGAAGTDGSDGANGSSQGGGTGGTVGCDPGGKGATVSCTTVMGSTICLVDPATPSGLGGTSSDTTCTVGMNGADGADGMSGADGGGGSIGPDGFTPANGQNGTAGANGQGAGGGGAKQYSFLKHGGGGGAGGCGASASTGGKGGGSSFAIVSLNATITFHEVTAEISGNAGDGGAGGANAPGGDGGTGGTGHCTGFCNQPSHNGCSGGTGGAGGNGGAGGGGGGGHAAIIAYTGVLNPLMGLTATAPAATQAGEGGGTAPDGMAVLELPFL